jgi:hypothetical protein
MKQRQVLNFRASQRLEYAYGESAKAMTCLLFSEQRQTYGQEAETERARQRK